MGNSESGCGGGSGDEDDIETEIHGIAEDSPASAATGGGGSGSGRSGRGSNNVSVATSGPPSPGVLLEQVKLREAAARISDSKTVIQESVLAGNEGVLVRWLEDRVNRGEESVNLEQFCEILESRDASRDECEEVCRHGTTKKRRTHGVKSHYLSCYECKHLSLVKFIFPLFSVSVCYSTTLLCQTVWDCLECWLLLLPPLESNLTILHWIIL